jgi:hypothetical protein
MLGVVRFKAPGVLPEVLELVEKAFDQISQPAELGADYEDSRASESSQTPLRGLCRWPATFARSDQSCPAVASHNPADGFSRLVAQFVGWCVSENRKRCNGASQTGARSRLAMRRTAPSTHCPQTLAVALTPRSGLLSKIGNSADNELLHVMMASRIRRAGLDYHHSAILTGHLVGDLFNRASARCSAARLYLPRPRI